MNRISKQLFLENGWTLPEGFCRKSRRDPPNVTREKWRQEKGAKQDPRHVEATLQEGWVVSDSRTAFEKALEEQGFCLAKGARRGFMAVDFRGEAYLISR